MKRVSSVAMKSNSENYITWRLTISANKLQARKIKTTYMKPIYYVRGLMFTARAPRENSRRSRNVSSIPKYVDKEAVSMLSRSH